MKKATGISTFNFTTLYTIIPHNFLINVLPEVINLFSNEKLDVSLAFQKDQATGHQKVVEEDSSQFKL